ncbi:hypothetical protein TNCV_4972811 [Trichonephila clavipes]|nr:hypothetical protein TNCV_4972811 [Trichonephila clavipes]
MRTADDMALHSPNFDITPMILSLGRFNVHHPLYTVELLRYNRVSKTQPIEDCKNQFVVSPWRPSPWLETAPGIGCFMPKFVEIGGVAIYRKEFPTYLTGGNFTELNRTVTCMVLKAKANGRRTSSPLPR